MTKEIEVETVDFEAFCNSTATDDPELNDLLTSLSGRLNQRIKVTQIPDSTNALSCADMKQLTKLYEIKEQMPERLCWDQFDINAITTYIAILQSQQENIELQINYLQELLNQKS